MSVNETDFISIKQAANLLGMSIGSLYNLKSERNLPFGINVFQESNGKRIRFSRNEIESYLERLRTNEYTKEVM